MPVCPKCHRRKKKSYLSRHALLCRPSKAELKWFAMSKSSSTDAVKRKQAKRAQRDAQKKVKKGKS